MKVEKKGNNLVITIEMNEPELSTSKKSFVVASTNGNQKTDLLIEGENLVVGVNAYYKNKDYGKN